MTTKHKTNKPVWILIAALSALSATSALAQLNKCKEDNGKIVYSDRPCRPPPPAPAPKIADAPATPPTAKPAVPVAQAAPNPSFNKAVGGKLSESSVAALIKHASDLAVQSDYRGQCALAATDLKFNITDHSSRPATNITGGRKEMCDLQRDSAQLILSAQLQPAVSLGKLAISVNSAATQATASYESFTVISTQGQVAMRLRCVRKEVLSVYLDQILYTDVNAVCKPQ